jgi:hypothetical protein
MTSPRRSDAPGRLTNPLMSWFRPPKDLPMILPEREPTEQTTGAPG